MKVCLSVCFTFPEPVLAIPTTSFPDRIFGIAFLWIGFGKEYPGFWIPFKVDSNNPKDLKLCDEFSLFHFFRDISLLSDEKKTLESRNILIQMYLSKETKL